MLKIVDNAEKFIKLVFMGHVFSKLVSPSVAGLLKLVFIIAPLY